MASFIEGNLSLATGGGAGWTNRWCKVDKNEFSWAAGEAAPPLGRVSLAQGGTVMPTADAHGLFRFNLYADGRVLECSALSEAELDGWLDFFVAETSVQKSDKAPAMPKTKAPAPAANGGGKKAAKVTQKAVVAALIKEAIEMEEFEKCVKYRKFRSILDDIQEAVADEDFEKCVELRAAKKKLEQELPEISVKKHEMEKGAAGGGSGAQAPAAAAAAAASAKSSGKVTDLDAIKSKLWSSKTSTPSHGVSALLDDLPSKSRAGFGRETTAAQNGASRNINFKAWKAGDPSDDETDSDSESLVKGGAVRFADNAKRSDGGGRKAEYAMRTTWSGGGNMLEEAERRRKEQSERKKERKEKKLAEMARIAAEEKAKARAKKAMADREREAKWAKFAPKVEKKDPKMLSWDGGFTKKKALEMSLSEDEGDDTTEQRTIDDREELDESDDQSLVKKKKKKKAGKVAGSGKAASSKKKKLSKADKKKKRAEKKARAAMSSTWGGMNALAPLVSRAADERQATRKKKKKKKKKKKTGESTGKKKKSESRFRDEWKAGGDSFSGNVSLASGSSGGARPKSALKKPSAGSGLQSAGGGGGDGGGLSRAADAPDVAAARRVTQSRATVESSEDSMSSSASKSKAPEKKKSRGFLGFGKKK